MSIDLSKPQAIKPISEVAVGDRIAVCTKSRRFGGRTVPFSILTVERLTATRFVTNKNRRFRIEDGKEIGNGYTFDRAVIVGDEFVAAIESLDADIQREDKLRGWLYKTGDQYRSLPIEAIAAMRAAYDDWAAKQPVQEAA